MDITECRELIPRVLEKNYPGQWAVGEVGDQPYWEVRHHPASLTTVTVLESDPNVFVRIGAGLLNGVPFGADIFEQVNEWNVELVMGAVFVRKAEGGVYSVFARSPILSSSLTWAFPATVQAFVSRVRFVVETSPVASMALQQRLGGQFFQPGWGAHVVMST